MLSDDSLSAVGAVMSFVKTVIEQVRNAAALTYKTTDAKGPEVSDITGLIVDNGLNSLFATLASYIDGIVIHFGIGSGIKGKNYNWMAMGI